MFCCFSLEAVLQGVAKNNATEKQIYAEIQATLRHAPEAVTRRMSCEKDVLKNLARDYARASFLIKLQALGNFVKREALAQVISYEFCEIFKNTFFIEHHRWLFLNMLSHGFHMFHLLLFFKISIADFEHVFVCLKRYRITIVVLRILEIPYPASKYSKSTTEMPKQNLLKSVKS